MSFLKGSAAKCRLLRSQAKPAKVSLNFLILILLAAELEGISADPSAPGEGVVIEAHVDNKRGNTATL
jgi:translation initiation factor IF-2